MKSGLISFPLEVDLNDKMNLLEAEFGIRGFAVMIKLFQYIYSKGYYTQWDIDVGCLFARERCPDAGWQFVSEVVACSIRRGIFDKDLFDKYQILTSERIQETYLIATKRRKEVELDKKYLLPIAYTFIRDVNISSIYVYKNQENVCINEQRKGKERKGKERKEEYGDKPPLSLAFIPPTLEEIEAYCKDRRNKIIPKKFYDFFNASGWVDSKGNKVQNWKQKVITWEKHEQETVNEGRGVYRHNYSEQELDKLIDDVDSIEI